MSAALAFVGLVLITGSELYINGIGVALIAIGGISGDLL